MHVINYDLGFFDFLFNEGFCRTSVCFMGFDASVEVSDLRFLSLRVLKVQI